MNILKLILVFLSLPFLVSVLHAQPSPASDHVDIRLITQQNFGVSGGEMMIGLHFEIEDGWHVYWQNPGDSGMPVRVSWTANDYFSFGSIQWPYPMTFQEEHLITYGYKDETLLMLPVTITENAPKGTYTAEAFIQYLACERICLPGFETHTIQIEIRDEKPVAKSGYESLFERFASKLPVESNGLNAYFERNNDVVSLELTGDLPEGFEPETLRFFASAENQLESSSPQKFEFDGNSLKVDLRVSRYLNEEITTLPGVLVVPSNGNTKAVTVLAKPKR